jgi:hypothetical protein
MTIYILIVLFGGGLSSGHSEKIGVYNSEQTCQAARGVLIQEDTPLSKHYVICVPADKEPYK